MHRKLVLVAFGASLVALMQARCGTGAGGRPKGETGGTDAGSGGASSTGNGTSSTTGSGSGSGGMIIIVGDSGRTPPRDAASTCDGAAACMVGCGNSRIDPGLGEVCDDGNNMSLDGCSADCKTIEKDWGCLMPGSPCVNLVKCGDNRLGGRETCDDGNTKDGDGCSGMCAIEKGWDCPVPGQFCVPRCGDGILTSTEECDPPAVGAGCSAACKNEPGYVCNTPPATPNPNQPSVCHKTVCGDGKKEGTEACDDLNVVDGDGCSAGCTFEPDCATGQCTSKCGDGMKLPPEACDDGNTKDGDGCSHDCKSEMGYTCMDSSLNPPARLNLLAIYRDFISIPTGGGVKHADFESFGPSDVTKNLVKPTLDVNGKPAIDGRCSLIQPASITNQAICLYGQELSTEANFKMWYRDTAGSNITLRSTLVLPRQPDGSYIYDSANLGFYPIDNKGWTAPPVKESFAQAAAGINDGMLHNFGFTSEIRYFFQYTGGESLTFSGDDDVWVFVNRTLGLDLGGLHTRTQETLNMDASAAALGLKAGGIYEVALFHAERHTTGSNFKLTLTGFAPTYSTCGPTCGDAVVAGTEQCDLGRDMNTGGYNGCTADCKRGPYCGDKIVQVDHEQCDDGLNVTPYSMTGAPGCAPGCVLSSFCGDAKVDSLFGEQCDKGRDMNTGAYNGCTAMCQLGPRCGDGVIQRDAGEQCDDGNTVSGDGCTFSCLLEIPE